MDAARKNRRPGRDGLEGVLEAVTGPVGGGERVRLEQWLL